MLTILRSIAPTPRNFLLLLFIAPALFSGCGDDDLEAPDAKFTASANNLTLTLISTTAGEVDTYSWDFGDGQTGSGANVTHTYAVGGTYTVTHTATNSAGSSGAVQTFTLGGGPSGSEAITLEIPNADAQLFAINLLEFPGPPFLNTVERRSGQAWFLNNGEKVPVGTVSLSGEDMGFSPQNEYTLAPEDGFFPADPQWSQAAGNGFPAINRTVSLPFPGISRINTPGVQSLNTDLTVNLSTPVTGADSVLVSVTGPLGALAYRAPKDFVAHTFSAQSVFQQLGAGENLVRVSAYRFESETIGGKTYYFIQESTTTKIITLQ